ncbi:hypothetical protein LTR95_004943 [Oleoguttula sp. CCFEE 5521]
MVFIGGTGGKKGGWRNIRTARGRGKHSGRVVYYRPTFQATFQVLVGSAPSQQAYTLHDDIFLLRSVYFASARSKAWHKDGKAITLTEEKPEVFEAYLRCVHLGSPGFDLEEHDWFTKHTTLYVLADKLGDLQAANFIIDQIAQASGYDAIPTASEANLVYEHSAEFSPLRRLLVDILAHGWVIQECGRELLNNFPKDILRDVLLEIDYEKAFKVTVGSGSDQKTLTIHDDLVIHRSTFFKSARSSAWTDGATPVDLTDEKRSVFETYMHCVQYDEIDAQFRQDGFSHFTELCDLYALADKLGDLLACNLTMDKIIDGSKPEAFKLPNQNTIAFAYDHTVHGSPLRRVIAVWHLHEWSGKIDGETENPFDKFPAALWQDMVREYWTLKQSGKTKKVIEVFCQKPRDRPKCHYHQHNDSHPPCTGVTVIDT